MIEIKDSNGHYKCPICGSITAAPATHRKHCVNPAQAPKPEPAADAGKGSQEPLRPIQPKPPVKVLRLFHPRQQQVQQFQQPPPVAGTPPQHGDY